MQIEQENKETQMKKKLKANTAVVLGLAALCPLQARAQSSVTLYGMINGGVSYTSNVLGSSRFGAQSGNVGSRFGLKGSEDLGGGLHAIFKLEEGFSVLSGVIQSGAGKMFSREAWVGLSSDRYGAVTLGRQYDTLMQFVGPYTMSDTFFAGPEANHAYDNDELDGSFRVNNAVAYQSPNYGGFQFGALYGFSNQPGNFGDNRAYSFGASYIYGPFSIAAGYRQLNANIVDGNVSNTNGAVTPDNILIAGTQRTYGMGLGYTVGPLAAHLVFTQTRAYNSAGVSSGFTGLPNGIPFTSPNVVFTNYEANAFWYVTPTLLVVGGYTLTDARVNGGAPKFHQLTLESSYFLSKRTDVFVQGEYQHVAGAQGLGLPPFILNAGTSSGPNIFFAMVGIHMRF
jgi:GBP family porin